MCVCITWVYSTSHKHTYAIVCSVLLLTYFDFNGIYVFISISISISKSVSVCVPVAVSVDTYTSTSIHLSLSIYISINNYFDTEGCRCTWSVPNSHKPYQCKLYAYFMRNVLISTLSYCERREMRINWGVFTYFVTSKAFCNLCNPWRVVIHHTVYDLCYFFVNLSCYKTVHKIVHIVKNVQMVKNMLRKRRCIFFWKKI